MKMFSHEFWNKTARLSNPHLSFTARLLLREDLCFWSLQNCFCNVEQSQTVKAQKKHFHWTKLWPLKLPQRISL